MGSAITEGELWSAKALDFANLTEPLAAPLWAAMQDAAKVGQGKSFFDLGCGAGGASMLAASRGADVWGFDAAPALVDIAKERVPNGQFEVGEMERLPYKNGIFDVVFASNAIQYADDQGQAVREALRVKKPDGQFVMGMWCEPERCDLMTVMRSIGALMPPSPEGSPEPPPSLSIRANLFELLESNGAKPINEGEVECLFEFPSQELLVRTLNAAGIVVLFARAIGQERVNDAIVQGCDSYRREDGTYAFSNRFRWSLTDKTGWLCGSSIEFF